MKVFTINGRGGVGKTTFEYLLKEVCEEKNKNLNIHILSMVDTTKYYAHQWLGWDGQKDEKSRRMLSDLKDLLARYDDRPYQSVKSILDNANDNDIFFIDAREEKDIERLVADYDAQTVLVDNDTFKNKHYGNHADDDVYNMNYDIVVENNGTVYDLRVTAETFAENFIF